MAMRWRSGAAPLGVPRLAAVFLASLVVAILVLRPGSTRLYNPRISALYSPPHADTPSHTPIHSSVVVPAYHERDNLAPLVRAVFASVRDPAGTEVVVVDDDSRDGTVQEVERLRREEGFNVELLVRTDEKGLSSAVLRGFERARGDKMLVMDADLQVRGAPFSLPSSRGLAAFPLTLPLPPPPPSCTAPSASRPAPPRRPVDLVPARTRHPLRRGRQHVQGLAPAPPHHLVGRARPRSPAHERERPYDGLLRHHERAGAPV